METDNKPTVTINQAKILYLLANYDKTDFGVGDFETDLESFQAVADAIDELIEREMITAGEWHRESRGGGRKRDKIHRCKLTEEGIEELDRITAEFLNSKEEFKLEEWQ